MKKQWRENRKLAIEAEVNWQKDNPEKVIMDNKGKLVAEVKHGKTNGKKIS